MTEAVFKIALAKTRAEWMGHAEGALLGAFGEHVKWKTAEANGYAAYSDYWRKEVSTLLDRLAYAISADTKARFDKRAAMESVVAEVRRQRERIVRQSKAILARRYFKDGRTAADLLPPDEDEIELFWVEVSGLLEDSI